jgi:hypothetical protein
MHCFLASFFELSFEASTYYALVSVDLNKRNCLHLLTVFVSPYHSGIAIASGIAFLIVVIIVVVLPSIFVGGRRYYL